MTMTEYTSAIGTVLQSLVTWIPQVIAIFTGNPVLLFFLGLSVVGILIGIVRSLVRGA